MPAKPQKDKGSTKPFKAGDIKITIDTGAAEKGAANLRKMFDRLRERIMQKFIEWLESEEGQKELKKAIQEELKR